MIACHDPGENYYSHTSGAKAEASTSHKGACVQCSQVKSNVSAAASGRQHEAAFAAGRVGDPGPAGVRLDSFLVFFTDSLNIVHAGLWVKNLNMEDVGTVIY